MTVSGSSSTSMERRQRKWRIRTSLMKMPSNAGFGAAATGATGVLAFTISLRLKPAVARELQRATVLSDRTHDVVRSTTGDLSFDFQRHPHGRPDQPNNMSNNFIRDSPGIAPNPRGIKIHRAVVTPWFGRLGRSGAINVRRRLASSRWRRVVRRVSADGN